MKKQVKNFIAAAALGAATLMPTAAHSQSRNYLEVMVSEKKEASDVHIVRPNLFYELPGDIKGFTFIELYGSGQGYHAKTNLTKDLGKGFALRAQTNSFDEIFSRAGFGAQYNIPTPSGTVAQVKVLPVYIGKDGSRVENLAIAGFYTGTKIKGFNLAALGEMNVAATGGPKWAYGEMKVSRNIGSRLEVGYMPGLRNDGNATPRLEHRLGLVAKF